GISVRIFLCNYSRQPFYLLSTNEAARYSLLSRAILLSVISLGQAASQAPVLVHAPNPSLSIWASIFTTRVLRSGFPCGNKARCDTLAPTNSMALLFLQAATQAPQPIHMAAAKASSALSFGIGSALPSTALPVFTL